MRDKYLLVPTAAILALLTAVLLIFDAVWPKQVAPSGRATPSEQTPPESEKPDAAQTERNSAPARLSGMVVDGVRVVEIVVRRFEIDPARVTVMQSEKVRLEILSRDIGHQIIIEGYEIDLKFKTGQKKEIAFLADKPGTYRIHVASSGGTGPVDVAAEGELTVLRKEK